jgi:hypothetical protein
MSRGSGPEATSSSTAARFGHLQTGLTAAGELGPPLDGPAVRRHWVQAVGIGDAGRMVAALCNAYPDGYSRERLAGDLDLAVSGGTFSTYLSRLSSNGLIHRNVDGTIRASDDLFPETPE